MQNNSSDVPTNVITELKDDDHKEPSVIEKGTSSFNLFECGKNLLDQLDVKYQRAFMATPIPEGFYFLSPERERYYDKMAERLITAKVGSDGTINNDELNKAINQLKYEKESEHERNILYMKQVYEYMSPGKNKDASTVNDSEYHNLDEYKDKISDSSKHIEASKESTQILTLLTEFVTYYTESSVSSQPSPESESLDEGDVASPKA